MLNHASNHVFAIPLTIEYRLKNGSRTTTHHFFTTRTHTLLLPAETTSIVLSSPQNIPLVLKQPLLSLSELRAFDASFLERETRSRYLLLQNGEIEVADVISYRVADS